LLFVGFAGLTLLYVAAVDPGVMERSAVSWLRFVQTVSIGFLAAFLVRSPRDAKVLLTAVAIAGIIVVGTALIGGVGSESEETLGVRGGGTVGPNSLGLTSGLLLLMAVLGGLGPQLLYRIPLFLVGAVGLVQSQSVGGIVGTCVAVTLGVVLLHSNRTSGSGLRALRAVAAVVVAIALAYGFASAVRPENLPHTEGFQTSSTWHRTVVGAAGVELALRNPVIGVGWRRSSEAHVIGDPDLTRDLRMRFSGTRDEFFPDVEPTSVHNAYVQVAAETGLIGLVLLGLLLFSLGRDITRLLQRVPRDGLLWRQLWYLTWALVLVLVWLNDNPIFGGQVETVVLVAVVGAIAGLGRYAVPPPTQDSPSASR
jgi:O-antigen ligase